MLIILTRLEPIPDALKKALYNADNPNQIGAYGVGAIEPGGSTTI